MNGFFTRGQLTFRWLLVIIILSFIEGGILVFALIAIFASSFFGLKIMDYSEKNLSLKDSIYYYVIILMFTNIVTNIITYLCFNVSSDMILYLNTLPIFFAKYTLTAIVVSVLSAIIIIVFKKNVSFKVEVVKNEEKSSEKRTKKKTVKKNS